MHPANYLTNLLYCPNYVEQEQVPYSNKVQLQNSFPLIFPMVNLYLMSFFPNIYFKHYPIFLKWSY